jgi:hypothetical protein
MTEEIDPNHPVKGGFYVGANNKTIHADGLGDDSNEIVFCDIVETN